MQIGTEQIRELRERTGAGIMDCKRALEEHDGDVDKAENALRDKGIVKARSKAGRATSEGLVEAYIHAGCQAIPCGWQGWCHDRDQLRDRFCGPDC